MPNLCNLSGIYIFMALFHFSFKNFLRILGLIQVFPPATILSSISEMIKTWGTVPHRVSQKHHPHKAVSSFEGKGDNHLSIPSHINLILTILAHKSPLEIPYMRNYVEEIV